MLGVMFEKEEVVTTTYTRRSQKGAGKVSVRVDETEGYLRVSE